MAASAHAAWALLLVSGAVLAQSDLPIGELETAGELHDRLAADGAPLMLRVLEELATGRAVETPQDESQTTIYFTMSTWVPYTVVLMKATLGKD